MSDTWTGIDETRWSADRAARLSTGKRRILSLVEQNLRGELCRLRGRRPHAKLGVDAGAPRAQIESAFVRQMRQYDPSSFHAYGPGAVHVAVEIVGMLCEAREQLLVQNPGAGNQLPRPQPLPWWRRLLTG